MLSYAKTENQTWASPRSTKVHFNKKMATFNKKWATGENLRYKWIRDGEKKKEFFGMLLHQ